ncbi:uncharacterized protein LOC122664636 [Telopea speciosissima]|uniref:uncharacterized protein LOC122664636 n=1 Tax=Telopea speciosissima TaxID=54955 RepID=UPI001CC51475|nr:uncharacterized protein LOC122664636 [Telopea speciosissima]
MLLLLNFLYGVPLCDSANPIMLSLYLPGPFMSPASSNGLRQWLWCGNMEKNLGMNLGKGFLGLPLLGGALCACTWHFFYNSESLEVLVALQAALTVVDNFTMCIAAYCIYKCCQGGSGTQ